MSLEQIEQQIQQLPAGDLIRLAEWFKKFLASGFAGDWQETPELVAELDRRLAEFMADPSLAAPFEPDYFETLKRELRDEGAQEAPAR
jgi:hypothetical protein